MFTSQYHALCHWVELARYHRACRPLACLHRRRLCPHALEGGRGQNTRGFQKGRAETPRPAQGRSAKKALCSASLFREKRPRCRRIERPASGPVPDGER